MEKTLKIGDRIGKWTIIGDSIPNAGYLCKCDCGTEKRVKKYYLINNKSKQCSNCRYEELWRKHVKVNKYDLSGEYGIGWTTNTNKPFYFDKDKYDLVKSLTWSEASNHQIISGHTYLHLLIIGKENIPPKMVVEHINGDLTDNRMENLNITTKQQSLLNRQFNSKIYPGVSKNSTGTYSATIRRNGKSERLGTYKTAEEAIKVRMTAEKEVYGRNTKVSKKYNVNNIEVNPIKTRGKNLSAETKEILKKYYPSMGIRVIDKFNLNISSKSIYTITSRMGLKFTKEN